MTAISITPANVAWVSGPIKSDQIAGEAFAAGDAVYLADNGKWYKAQADGTAVEAGANDLGVSLATAAGANARVSIAVSGAIVTIGGTVVPGTVYVPGDTAGAINPVADQGSTDKITVLGIGISATQIQLQRIYNAGSVI